MKYTASSDGIYRITVLPKVRLEKYEYILYNRAAKKLGYKSLADWLGMFLNGSVWREMLSDGVVLEEERG